ncbi:hypothetical protein H072_3801 [Dactylellina haptotyla CBS 200.50]|uniref:gamma-glutamylcyclotransferase n=1 Tax=Dactylellina haptotyla (strain CBS 200.50) TaxID=1284197 RepID=S8AMA8_DACHA|nr:hypothetical protein H072_3801 [Dactylellina haptotyla CBS 200.50]
MATFVNRALYGRRHNVTRSDAAQMARPATAFPSPNFKENFKYLAYGSNLSAETFLGRRGIKPLSQVTVRVPTLTLAFDLAGIPYKEPRFANVRSREEGDQELMGVVYEVTPKDYSTILMTEGGYNVISATCIPLTPVEGIPSFEANTLIVPTGGTRTQHDGLPSLRYLNLLLRGAEEHRLPQNYQKYLADTGYYKASTWRQKTGSVSVLLTALPVVVTLFALRAILSDKKGKAPNWLNTVQRWCFARIWSVYDHMWRPLYGDGENDKHTVENSQRVEEGTGISAETDALLGKMEEVTAATQMESGSRA